MVTRSHYRSFMAKEKLMIWCEWKLYSWLAQKTKHDLQRRIVIVGHFAARRQGIRSLRKGCAIMWTIKDNMDAQLLVKCANWNLYCCNQAIRHHGFQSHTSSLWSSSWRAVPTWLVVGISVAWQQVSMHNTHMPHCPLLVWDSL